MSQPKLHFESNLSYQIDAIDAVCDLFRGNEGVEATEFTVTLPPPEGAFDGMETSNLGLGNRLRITDSELLTNLQEVQRRNNLPESEHLDMGDLNFTVEMETGTGKTYVYLRTILELHKRFKFTKFVIVVPSVAIKEGVQSSIRLMEGHFKNLYPDVVFDSFLYDSSKLGSVRTFATSSTVQVMIMTVGAINKKEVNNLYKFSEQISDLRPIDLITQTRPILIVDEPQSVDGTTAKGQGQGRLALKEMEPLFTLRYSATHVTKYDMIYRLDAIDAYTQRLVKEIEVAAATVEDAYNKPYVRFVQAGPRRGPVSAMVELNLLEGGRPHRRVKQVYAGNKLEQTTANPLYEGMRVGRIDLTKAAESIEIITEPARSDELALGEALHDIDATAFDRLLIRRTIREHLEKEMRLRSLGIKVLSLFFLKSVDHYRRYDDYGNQEPGEYAKVFEEEYANAIGDYADLFDDVDTATPVADVHGGYFSKDKQSGRFVDTSEGKAADRERAAEAYELIMRDKEGLLSFDKPLKFIFSHSALREGWDNPNVFQICALREIRADRERRQTIGRGLRLCVNQAGERVTDESVNTLTVIASESYEDFAENLQREIEETSGIRFGFVESHAFAAISYMDENGMLQSLGSNCSRELRAELEAEGYLDGKGKILDAMKQALKENRLVLSDDFEPHRGQIEGVLRKLAGKLGIRNADDRRQVEPRREVLDSPEFQELWDRIKAKSRYRVDFDHEALIKTCIQELRIAPPVPMPKVDIQTAVLAIDKSGVSAEKREGTTTTRLREADVPIPDVLTALQDQTQLTRRTVGEILAGLGDHHLEQLRYNPQGFIKLVAETVNRAKAHLLVQDVVYERLDDEEYDWRELFLETEQKGYEGEDGTLYGPTYKAATDSVVVESSTEREFVSELETRPIVKAYAKLPRGFTIPTPLGTYNPDWAIVIDREDGERCYAVIETKSAADRHDLRRAEDDKIKCGEAHFRALAGAGLSNPATFDRATSFGDVWTILESRRL